MCSNNNMANNSALRVTRPAIGMHFSAAEHSTHAVCEKCDTMIL